MSVQVECVRAQALLLHLLLSSVHLCTGLGLSPWSVLQLFCNNLFSLFAEGEIGRTLSPSLQRKMNPKLEILLWPVGLLYRKDITLG